MGDDRQRPQVRGVEGAFPADAGTSKAIVSSDDGSSYTTTVAVLPASSESPVRHVFDVDDTRRSGDSAVAAPRDSVPSVVVAETQAPTYTALEDVIAALTGECIGALCGAIRGDHDE